MRKEIFEGKETDKKGKIHDIYRETCMKCGKTIAEYHRGCCGYMSNGYMETEHKCKPHDCIYKIEGNRGYCIHCNREYEGDIVKDTRDAKIVDIGREPRFERK